MKKLITASILLVSFAFATPGAQGATPEQIRAQIEAWLEWYNSRNDDDTPSSNTSGGTAVEQAAHSINGAIAEEAGGNDGRYLEYSRRLAMTLNQKSKAELKRVFDSNDTLGLGG